MTAAGSAVMATVAPELGAGTGQVLQDGLGIGDDIGGGGHELHPGTGV